MANYKVDITGINTNNLRVLKNSEMNLLFERMFAGDKNAREELINGNLKLVLSIIKKYINSKHNLDDLFQVGCIGLVKAVDNFDPKFNCLFSTYAVPLILGEVKRYIRDSKTIRVSRGIRDLSYKILEYKEKYIMKYDKEPSISLLCKTFDITEYELSKCLDSLKDVSSIFDPVYNDGGETILLLDQIANKETLSADYLLSIKDAINKLCAREKEVIVARYYNGLTQMELAGIYNISQAQISRIEKSGLDNIKKILK